MANRRKKDKILSFFKKSDIDVSLFYKPSGKDADIFYTIIMNNTIQLCFKVSGNVIVIDKFSTMTDNSSDVDSMAIKLITYLVGQTSFNVLISKLGYISNSISSILDKLGVPVVNDDRFITVPLPLYKKYVEYYKDKTHLYGFYLISVLDDISLSNDEDINDTDDMAMQDINNIGDDDSIDDSEYQASSVITPLELKNVIMDELVNMAKSSGKFSISSSTEYSITIEMVAGISVELSVSLNEIAITDIRFSPKSPTTELLTFINSLLDKFNSDYAFNVYTNENDKNVVALCGVLDFQNMTATGNNRGRIVYHKGACCK